MSRASRRLILAAIVTALLVGGVQPVAAADPAKAPSVHAEMLEEHAEDATTFAPGGTPTALPADGSGGGTRVQGAGAIAGLPNGLSHEVFGYLPYWTLTGGNLPYLDYDLVTTIAYFSIGALRDGTLDTSTAGYAAWHSAAMTEVISTAHQQRVRVVLTVTMMAWDGNYNRMRDLLTNGTNRNRLARQIARAVLSRNADGVNLDFEPMPNFLESDYTLFVRKVKKELVAQGAGDYVTVATTGGAASWDEGYELTDNADPNQSDLVSPGSADAIMVMAYDFNWSGSARAGGVAPLNSAYTLDARRAMAAYLALVPASKLIWGIPYYGRSWTTTTSNLNGRTCSSSGTCTATSWASTYVDARSAAAAHGRRWDDPGQVPWYRYQSSTYGTWVQGYYDDPRSLGVKYEFAKANRVRGVGIWHLLMDGSRRELWTTIAKEFGPPPFTDVAGSGWEAAITWVYQHGVMVDGCSATRFCPSADLTRGALAQALADGLGLPSTSTDFFTDDGASRFEDGINRLAAAGLARGCGNRHYCPTQSVRRGGLALALATALELPAATRDYFSDDNASPHEDAINRIAAAGIASGCGGGRYCPNGRVSRGHAAVFLRNAFD